MGEAPVGSGVGEVDCRRCAVARGSTCRQWGGSGGLQVGSGWDYCSRAGGSTFGRGVGEVDCRRCAVAKLCVAGQGVVPVGNRVGQVASRCAVVRTGEAGQGVEPLAGWVRYPAGDVQWLS